MENTKAAMDIILSSKPCRGNNARPPTVLRIATRGVVQAGHPGVKAANALPNAVEPLLPLMAINLELFILKIRSDTLIPAKITVANVKAKDAVRYNGPIILTATETGTIESVR